MRLTVLLSGFALGFAANLLLAGVAYGQANKANETLFQIGTKKITLGEFEKRYEEVKAQTLNPPTKALFLEDLIRFEIGVQEAEKRKLQNDPIVQERIRQEMYKGLVEKEIGKRVENIKVSDGDMKEFYKKNPELRSSHILIEYKPDATAAQKVAAKKRAEEIWAEVKASKRPFEELVKLYSDDPMSKQTGGDIGWQTRVTLFPAYYEALLATKVGEMRALVETPFGYHIVKVTGRRTYENANKRQLRASVFDEKRRVIFNELFNKLKRQYSVKVNESLIK
ncbi:MAG: peptidylprolyl isomerase [Pseudobdellovibrionaceae bacterium]